MIFLLVALISQISLARVVSVPGELSELSVMLETPQGLSVLECHDDISFKTKSCSENQKMILAKAVDEAAANLDQTLRSVDIYLERQDIKRNQSLNREVLNIRAKLVCMKRKFGDLVLRCVNPGDRESHVCEDNIGGVLYISAFVVRLPFPQSIFYDTSSVRLCPNSFSPVPPTPLVKTIAHEVSHLCGTDDHAMIFSSDEVPLEFNHLGKQVLSSNADNYGWWVQNGFCIGDECRKFLERSN